MLLSLEHRNKKVNDIHKGQWNGLGGKFEGNAWYVFVFTTSEFTGELIDSPEGTLEGTPGERVLDLNLWENDHIFMPWIHEGKFFSAKLNMRQIRCGIIMSPVMLDNPTVI